MHGSYVKLGPTQLVSQAFALGAAGAAATATGTVDHAIIAALGVVGRRASVPVRRREGVTPRLRHIVGLTGFEPATT
jgi:hypothetical protein